MRRFLKVGGVFLAALMALPSGTAAGQSRAAARPGAANDIPRTADGRPDSQGLYFTATITPLERPEELGNRLVLSREEAAALERQNLDRNQNRNADSRSDRTAPAGWR